ncbi:MAG: hypothetical protein ACJAZK_000836 [Psychroserpens sp.]|jgi:hypothetical protein|uniref:hypothetical protein n=1 Tax=Psychroserpens sp. TaxID=2020870 RepID=UPI0039E481ED
MRIFKRGLTLLCTLVFALNLANSQDRPTMFAVHTDNVKFEMMPQYESLAKQMKEACLRHKIADANWTAISIEDGRYVYITPISSMADLDKNPMGSLSEKMGAEAVKEMLGEMDQCYDSHSDSVVHHIAELSFMPDGYNTEGKNHREYHLLYYAPKDGQAMKEAMANVKALFQSKNVKTGYDVFHSGFGSEENYYMVVISGKDDIEVAQSGLANKEAMGDEGQATLFNVIKLAKRYDQVEAEIRPDLSYNPSNN